MSRFKTSAFWIFVVLALGIGVYAYFNLKNNKKPQLDALSVLPDNCLVYLNTPDFFALDKKINSQSLIVDKLKLFTEIDGLCATVHAFDSICSTDENIEDVIKDNLIHFACYKEKQGWIAAFNIKQLGEQEDIAERLAKILSAAKSKADIYAFKLRASLLYFNLSEGVATLSNTQELIIQSLNKKNPKLQNNKAFLQFKSTLTENSLLSIYVDHSVYAHSESNAFLNLSYVCKKGHSAGAIDFQPSQIKANGYIIPGEEETLAFFRDQKPQASEDVSALLPFNTCFFKAFGFSSYPDLRIEFPLTNVHIKYWMRANERGLYNVEDDFNANLVNHIIDFETRVPHTKFISTQINDTIKAKENLKHMSDSVIRQDDLVIYRLNDSLEKPLQLFIPLSLNATNYALLYQSHIFFADQIEPLVQLMQNLKNNRTLGNDESFAAYKNQNFPDEFNYLLYTSPKQTVKDIPSFFNFKAESGEDPFRDFKHFSFSASNEKNAFKFRLHLMHETETRSKEQNILWTLNLDSTSSMTAAGFINHITGENEIVVQDNDNTLYLVNAKGTILWKKKLNEKILSAIYTVDIYKKNKYQLLFNTKNHLHLIDRNGNYVEHYPARLPAEASAALSLFDYDANKDYRLFIPCQNNRIYNYSIHGILQEKFVPVKTESELSLPVQYVKVGASDYLVALDKEGRIYTFSRKGVGRIGLRNRALANCQSFYVDAGNSLNSTYLVYVDDKSSLLNKISFEDKKEIAKLHAETENGTVTFNLVDDNKNMDVITTNHNAFQAYNFSGNLIVEKTFDFPLRKTDFYSDESHSLFYSLSEDETQLLIFNQLQSKTQAYNASAMPLISNLFNDNKKYLILTNGKQLSCMLLD